MDSQTKRPTQPGDGIAYAVADAAGPAGRVRAAGWDHGCARRAALGPAQMATGVMTADIRKLRPLGDGRGPTNAAAGTGVVVHAVRPAQGNTQDSRRRLIVVTEKTHPEAFGHDAPTEASDLVDGPADADVTALTDGTGETAPIVRRRGPLVTRWIGFSAQRRRARERSDRLQDRHHDAGGARSNS